MVLDPDSTPTKDVLLWLIRHRSLSPPLAREIRRQYCDAARVPTARPTPRPPAPGQSDTEARIRDVFRRLSAKYHPDRGGTDAAMIVVNDAREQVRQALDSGSAR